MTTGLVLACVGAEVARKDIIILFSGGKNGDKYRVDVDGNGERLSSTTSDYCGSM